MKFSIKSIFALALCFMISYGANAQQFLTPVSTLSGDATAVTQDGRTIEGDIRMAMFGMKGLMSFRIKDANTGEVEKFKAEDIKSLRIKMDGLAKLATLSDQTSNLRKMTSANFDEINEREFIYYEQVAWPGKKGKFLLVQKLNPGWDAQIQVYDYPAKKTATTSVGGIAVAGGDAKAFVVNYKGETIIVEKKDYEKKYFDQFFGNCSALQGLEKKDMRFVHFAEHVFTFEQECK